MQLLGDILKDLRIQKGATQSDLAKLLKIKRQTYSSYERNISTPDIASLIMLAAYFNVSLYYMLEEELSGAKSNLSSPDKIAQKESDIFINNILGERIKSLREHSELTQIELADMISISPSALAQYESGARNPSDDIKIKIADFFSVSVDYLLGRKSQEAKSDDYLSLEQGAILNLFSELPQDDVLKVIEYAELLKLKYR